MSATEELRRLLDERGVEYETDDAQVSDTEWYYVTKLRDGYHDRWTYEEPPDCDLLVSYQYDLGAEEAITATLGPAARHPKPHEQWATVLLPEIAWGWDDRWPDYLSVAHDAHGEWRVYVPEDTLGSSNCTNNCTNGERTGERMSDATRTQLEPTRTELLPCPFCGATDEVMTTRDFWAGAIPAEAEFDEEVAQLKAENARLRELVCHLYYAKPRDVTSILVNGEVLDFDELMAGVGLRWEDA